MKVIVIGATGTIGAALADRIEENHEVIRSSRRLEPRADLCDRDSLVALFDAVPDADAVVSCAASATPVGLGEDEFLPSLEPKLFGQVELVRLAVSRLRRDGSITLTGGAIPEGLVGAAGGVLVNAGLEAFVRAAAAEMPSGIRLNVVSPGWVRERLESLDLDPSGGTPAAQVVDAYVAAVGGGISGEVLTP